jgi:hypothetical protein
MHQDQGVVLRAHPSSILDVERDPLARAGRVLAGLPETCEL